MTAAHRRGRQRRRPLRGQRPLMPPALLLGSHIDTVRNAGKYDGNLGVIAAIQAVAALHAQRRAPALRHRGAGLRRRGRRALSGRPSPARRAVAGTFDPAAPRAARRGRRERCARRCSSSAATRPSIHAVRAPQRAGRWPTSSCTSSRARCWRPRACRSGVVTAIDGASRFTVEVAGMAGHAGTVPMELRQRRARRRGRDGAGGRARCPARRRSWSATVGPARGAPGAVNVIPAAARFTIDIRSPNDAVRDATPSHGSSDDLPRHRRAGAA